MSEQYTDQFDEWWNSLPYAPPDVHRKVARDGWNARDELDKLKEENGI